MMEQVRALLFTQGEAGTFKAVPFLLYKKDFIPEQYSTERFKAYSEMLHANTEDLTLVIEGINVFALAFSDGTVYDTNGWRQFPPAEDWVLKVHKDKTQLA